MCRVGATASARWPAVRGVHEKPEGRSPSEDEAETVNAGF